MTIGKHGFTFIELSIVLAVLGILYAIATPVVFRNLKMAKEAALKEDLRSLRKAIDAYRADFRKYPRSLSTLVEKGYIYKLPEDPFTGKSDSWVVTEQINSEQSFDRGVSDVFSGSDEISLNGEAVATW